jgi:hypothetical protein
MKWFFSKQLYVLFSPTFPQIEQGNSRTAGLAWGGGGGKWAIAPPTETLKI